MLAITANWGIGDGSLAEPRAGRALAWLDAIRRVVVRAGWGRDGRYRPAEQVTLLFAGDTFDWLLSDTWSGRDRPWHGGVRGEEVRGRVALQSLRAARPVLRTLARWAATGIPVPAATPRGRPSEWAWQATRVSAVLLAGDRDAWLTDHAAMAARFGIATGEEWSDGERHVRHGHDLDPLTYRDRAAAAHQAIAAGRGGRQPTLAESLMTDLAVPFAVAARSAVEAWPVVRPRLTALAAARPADWPAVMAGLVDEGCEPAVVRSLWRRAVAAWHGAAVRDLPACETEFDVLGELADWLDRGSAKTAAPAAIRRLDVAPHGCPAEVAIVADQAPALPPSLTCHGFAGPPWSESLDGPPPGPSIVAVGVGHAGTGFVDAA
jgi:hypothetical protein